MLNMGGTGPQDGDPDFSHIKGKGENLGSTCTVVFCFLTVEGQSLTTSWSCHKPFLVVIDCIPQSVSHNKSLVSLVTMYLVTEIRK